MARPVDSERQTAHDGKARVDKLMRKPRRLRAPVRGRRPRPDHGDRVVIFRAQFAAHVENPRGRGDIEEPGRIARVVERENRDVVGDAKFNETLDVERRTRERYFARQNGPDLFDARQIALVRVENRARGTEILDETKRREGPYPVDRRERYLVGKLVGRIFAPGRVGVRAVFRAAAVFRPVVVPEPSRISFAAHANLVRTALIPTCQTRQKSTLTRVYVPRYCMVRTLLFNPPGGAPPRAKKEQDARADTRYALFFWFCRTAQ